jgi:hypothetical protein
MKALAAILLAVTVALGVTGCGPSDEEKHQCVEKYIKDNIPVSFPKDLGPLNRELTKLCGVGDNYLRHPE